VAFLQNRPTQALYHYTSESGFRGILCTKKLWFSDLASANDPRELILGYETFIDALELVRQKDCSVSDRNLLTRLESDLASHHAHSHAFCCCFSMARDELPMWGTYGANHSGISIGFRPAAFLATPGRMQRVSYVDTNTLDDICTIIRYVLQHLSPNPNSDIHRIIAESEVLGSITALKHKSWSYEREFRMILMQSNVQNEYVKETSLLPNGTPVLWSKPLLRSGRVGSISYLEFPFGKFRDGDFDVAGAIKEVVIGPNSQLSILDVENILVSNGYERVVVTKSDCQIR
jgi:hypothetical protein